MLSTPFRLLYICIYCHSNLCIPSLNFSLWLIFISSSSPLSSSLWMPNLNCFKWCNSGLRPHVQISRVLNHHLQPGSPSMAYGRLTTPSATLFAAEEQNFLKPFRYLPYTKWLLQMHHILTGFFFCSGICCTRTTSDSSLAKLGKTRRHRFLEKGME